MLDMGVPMEDVKEDTKDDDSDSSSSSGSEQKEGAKPKDEALAAELDVLKSELSEAKNQIARLLEIQEAVARQVLSRGTIRSLFES